MTKEDAPKRVTILSVSLASGIAILVAAQAFIHSVVLTPQLQVEEMEVVWSPELKRPIERFRLNPPTSIFHLDLNGVADALRKRYPTAEVEAVRRILPNRLVATLRLKSVVAQVHAAGRYYPITEEGTILSVGQASPWPHLPIFYLDGYRGTLRVGQTIDHSSFESASELLAAVLRQGGIAGYQVGSIRVKGRDLTLFLDSGLEIRFDADRLQHGWERLLELLTQKRQVLEEARYLDLRFEDPIIGGSKKR